MSHFSISTKKLCKSFGSTQALLDCNLDIPQGSVFGLIGQNGAGKTTLIRCLAGLLSPDKGEAKVLDMNLGASHPQERSKVCIVSQEITLSPNLSISQWASLHRLHYPNWDEQLFKQLLDSFGIDHQKPTSAMSVGQTRKVALALAYAAKPEVLIMDEPAAGLDPIARRQLIDVILQALENNPSPTVLFSTHILQDLERACDRVGFMEKGKMLWTGELEALRERFKKVQIISEDPKELLQIDQTMFRKVNIAGSVLNGLLEITKGDEIRFLEMNSAFKVQVFPLNLEECFIEMSEQEVVS